MRKRVLVVEDNEINRELVSDILDMLSYDVLTARDGEEGIRIAKDEKPDLILMDIQLPKIDGLQAVRILKSDDSTRMIPIIALTAFALKGDEAVFLEAGCADYIPKPMSIRNFISTVERSLQ